MASEAAVAADWDEVLCVRSPCVVEVDSVKPFTEAAEDVVCVDKETAVVVETAMTEVEVAAKEVLDAEATEVAVDVACLDIAVDDNADEVWDRTNAAELTEDVLVSAAAPSKDSCDAASVEDAIEEVLCEARDVLWLVVMPTLDEVWEAAVVEDATVEEV